MLLTTSDPVCIARDPASLEAEWSELARRRAYPTVFLTPEWIAVARAHDPREQITLRIADRGIAALARSDDGTISFAGGELSDYEDVVAVPSDVPAVASALADWIAGERATARFEYVPEEAGTIAAMAPVLAAAGHDVRVERLVSSPRVALPDTFDAYVQSLARTARHELRRKMRRLETGRRVEFRFAAERERHSVVDRFMTLHRGSRGEKAGFMTAQNERFFR